MSWRAQLSSHIRELRFVFNPNNKNSLGLRNFIDNNYSEIKMLNPALPFLVRAYSGPDVLPSVTAEYDQNVHKRSLTDASAEQVEATLKELFDIGVKEPKNPASRDGDVSRVYETFIPPIQARLD
eukprot:TRINITY_DN497_c0_g2_i1.p1 TRINITY_DN497_c0_g2~~TRINITY_DN497_c0_g2_i1.p1  ORF type:complete len:125 (+),score=12.19 TRINITY_DN497_c0_g2_i1:117-491(+)